MSNEAPKPDDGPSAKKPTYKRPCSNIQKQQRIDEILRIRLDGAEFWDVREYVREKEKEPDTPWTLRRRESPMSDGQLWRYIALTDREVKKSCSGNRKRLLSRHLAKRRNLYAKAVLTGDVRSALSVLMDEAKLLGLYPDATTKHEITGKGGAPIQMEQSPLSREEREARIREIILNCPTKEESETDVA